MSLNEIHIVLAKDAKGSLKPLYVGEDAAQAEAKYEGAPDGMEIVGILNFPVFSRQRNPAADVERQKEREQFTLNAEEAESKRKEIAAANLRKQAEAILTQAEKLDPKEKTILEPETADNKKSKKTE